MPTAILDDRRTISGTVVSRLGSKRHQVALLVAMTAAGLVGCQSFQRRMMQRSVQCGALCAEAREAGEQGNTVRANECMDAAIRQRPDDTETRTQLAETLWMNGRRAEALAEFRALCADQPHDTKSAGRLAIMEWEENQHARAAATAARVLRSDLSSREAWLVKARQEVEEGRLDDAFNSYLRLTQLAPDDVIVAVELGDLHLRRGQPDRARLLLKSAVENPQLPADCKTEVEWLLGVAHARSERWSAAIPLLEASMRHRNSTADDWCLIATARVKAGDLPGARLDLERAFAADPGCSSAVRLLHEIDLAHPQFPEPIVPAEFMQQPAR